MWFIVAALAAVPAWDDVVARPSNPLLDTRLSPDGTALYWPEVTGEGRSWVFRAAAVDRVAEPDELVVEAEGRPRQYWVPPARFVVAWPDGPSWVWDEGWTEAEPLAPDPRPFPGAPEVRLRHERDGDRYTVSRVHRETGEVLGTWTQRLSRGDRLIYDETGTPRAVRTERGARVTFRGLAGERSPRLPGWWTYPVPNGSRNRVTARPLLWLGDEVWALDGREREFVELVRVDATTGTETVAYATDADLLWSSTSPLTWQPDMVFASTAEPAWQAVDPALAEDLAWVQGALEGPAPWIDRSRDDRVWHLCAQSPDTGVACAVADRDAHTLTPTRSVPPNGWDGPRPTTRPVVIETPDGLSLHSYLVLPPGHDGDRPAEPLPTVIRMHGGPYARAMYAYDPLHAFLAARGYAVLELNYRGSTLMGRSVMEGADGERGGATQDDVRTATAWVVDQGIADPARIALMGHSFGGFATMLGLTNDPELYACGVAIAPTVAWAYRWIVPFLPRGPKQRAAYPRLDEVEDPVLVIHGTDDRVLPVSESRHVAKALGRRGHPVAYLEVQGGDHGLEDHEGPIAEAVDAFFAGCLGGVRGEVDPTTWPDDVVVTGGEVLGF